MSAPYHELDTVVLVRDLPEAGLRAGDLGAVVQVYGPDALEVEFVTAAGRTQAVHTLGGGRAAGARGRLAGRAAGGAGAWRSLT